MLRESLGLAQDDDIDRQGKGWLKNVWDDTLLPALMLKAWVSHRMIMLTGKEKVN